MEELKYDETGKRSFNDIYNRSNPLSYFSTLGELDYCIPQNAKPAFERVIAARREGLAEDDVTKIVDVGCSYGVNAALLKHGYALDELYAHYSNGDWRDRGALLEDDRAFYGAPFNTSLEFVGLDQADKAIGYAVESGALDDGVAADLEAGEAPQPVVQAVSGTDIVMSTGCVGYVTEASLERILEPNAERRPWMAHMVLRMFSYEPVVDMLDRHGYVTEKGMGLFAQRRFASEEERQHALDNLAKLGVDPTGVEADGWYAAEFFLSRPAEDAADAPIDTILDGVAASRRFAPR